MSETKDVRVKALPSQALLQSLLNYDPGTGRLYWKRRQPSNFNGKDARGKTWQANVYNARYAGVEAFTYTDKSGYKHGKIEDKKYQAHRIIWKLVYGLDPMVIDHINGDTSDNRITNLRSCSIAENSRNYAKGIGSSRYRGVCWVPRDRAWAARISNGKGGKISLGNHKDEVAAARAYDEAAKNLHGEYAVLNFPENV